MVNKQLADWIKSEEAQGYSEKQLRDYLLKQGYNSKDIDDTIKLFGKKETSTSFSAKDVFKPTILKCFFPALVLILIFVSFLINSAHVAPVREYFCDTLNNMEELRNFNQQVREKSFENNANPQELISLYQQEENNRKQFLNSRDVFVNHLKPLISGNLYFTVSMIYKLNFFFPTPCEALILGEGFTNTHFCRYYMSEESFNCINDYVNKQKQEFGAGRAAIGRLFSGNLPSYKKISFTSLLIHSIILIAIVYVIISLISFGRIKLSEQNKKNKLIINGSLIILPILLFFVFDFQYSLFLLPLIVVFVISSFIESEKRNKIFLYVMASILSLLLIGGIFVTNFIVNRNVIGSTIDSSSVERGMEYKVFSCENSKILSTEEKQQFGLDIKYLNEEWKVCDNPSCSDICKDYCDQKQFYGRRIGMLRGDNPSCICGC